MRTTTTYFLVLLLAASLTTPSIAAVLQIRDATQQIRIVALQGVVYATINGSRQPIRGASVELENSGADAEHRIAASVVTDRAGRYSITNPDPSLGFYDVPPGHYMLRASYRTTRVSAGLVTISVHQSASRNIDLGTVVRAGGAPAPIAATTFFATDRLSGSDSSLADIFQNGRLITPCVTAPDCMMSYGVALANGPVLRPQKVTSVRDLAAQIHQTFPNATSVLVFIHGYNQDFQDPFEIGATWLSSINSRQPVIVYSWASNHQLPKYFDDETNNTWSQEHFRDFMISLMNDPNTPKQVDLFAHSMGNRLAIAFLDYVASAKPTTAAHLGQALFASPDVDSATFFEAIPRVSSVVKGLTMYGSNHDNALRASRAAHGHCRAGLVGCDFAIPDVENFNAIDASLFHCDFLGHSYWLSSATLQNDMKAVLTNGTMNGNALRANLKAGPVKRSYVFASASPGDTSCQTEAAPD